MFATTTKARKIQLKNELHTVEKKSMFVSDYALKIKGICESLASLNVSIDDDDKVACMVSSHNTRHLRRPFRLRRIYPILQNWCPC